VGLYSNNFAQVFSNLLDRTGISCYQINQYTHLDQSYLSRLRNGQKRNPSPETIVKISLGLVHFSDKVGLYDIEALFKAVGRSVLIDSQSDQG
jgi:transcriptional regulator with XRE-family HTH domain